MPPRTDGNRERSHNPDQDDSMHAKPRRSTAERANDLAEKEARKKPDSGWNDEQNQSSRHK